MKGTHPHLEPPYLMSEAAKVLAIDPSAASKRYIRAMKRLAELMADFVASESA